METKFPIGRIFKVKAHISHSSIEECKEALSATDGDADKAIEVLKKKQQHNTSHIVNEDLKTLIEITGGNPNDCDKLLIFSQFDLSYALRLIWSTRPSLSPEIEEKIKEWFKNNGKELVDWSDKKG